MGRKIFGNDAEPACRLCEHAAPMNERDRFACRLRGPVRGGYCCRKFRYDPTKRVPPPPLPKQQTFTPEDFDIE